MCYHSIKTIKAGSNFWYQAYLITRSPVGLSRGYYSGILAPTNVHGSRQTTPSCCIAGDNNTDDTWRYLEDCTTCVHITYPARIITPLPNVTKSELAKAVVEAASAEAALAEEEAVASAAAAAAAAHPGFSRIAAPAHKSTALVVSLLPEVAQLGCSTGSQTAYLGRRDGSRSHRGGAGGSTQGLSLRARGQVRTCGRRIVFFLARTPLTAANGVSKSSRERKFAANVQWIKD